MPTTEIPPEWKRPPPRDASDDRWKKWIVQCDVPARILIEKLGNDVGAKAAAAAARLGFYGQAKEFGEEWGSMRFSDLSRSFSKLPSEFSEPLSSLTTPQTGLRVQTTFGGSSRPPIPKLDLRGMGVPDPPLFHSARWSGHCASAVSMGDAVPLDSPLFQSSSGRCEIDIDSNSVLSHESDPLGLLDLGENDDPRFRAD